MGTAASSARVVNRETVLARRVGSAGERSAVFSGIVAEIPYTLFLQSPCAYACGEHERSAFGQEGHSFRCGVRAGMQLIRFSLVHLAAGPLRNRGAAISPGVAGQSPRRCAACRSRRRAR